MHRLTRLVQAAGQSRKKSNLASIYIHFNKALKFSLLDTPCGGYTTMEELAMAIVGLSLNKLEENTCNVIRNQVEHNSTSGHALMMCQGLYMGYLPSLPQALDFL